MPITITPQPPDPKTLRYDLKGLSGRQLDRIYWALHNYNEKHGTPDDDRDLMQLLWAGER